MIQFTVTSTVVPQIKGFIRDFSKAVNNQMEADAIVAIVDARNNHRHITRTGRLNRATTYKMSNRYSTVKFYINDMTANYGKYIHDGFKSWRPDRYLLKAVNRIAPKMYRDVSQAIAKIIKKNGLS